MSKYLKNGKIHAIKLDKVTIWRVFLNKKPITFGTVRLNPNIWGYNIYK